MSYGPGKSQNRYSQLSVQSDAAEASPHRLIQMLYEGALQRVARAKGHMERNETAAKGEAIGKVVSIVDYLRAVLDHQAGEVAENLDALYTYSIDCLLSANLHNDVSKLDEVTKVITTLKGAWDTIGEEVSHGAANDDSERLVQGAV